MSIAENIGYVLESMERASNRAGRRPEDARLVAVSKTVDLPEVREAYSFGLMVFGENRPQELERKAESLGDLSDVEWHFIGHLQRNKVKTVLERATLIHSVDSLRLVEEIEGQCAKNQRSARILFEVNVSGEESKSGFAPGEVLSACERVGEMAWVEVEGLMTMAPFTDDPEKTRPVFAALRSLAESLAEQKIPRVNMRHLSMGMSNDFEVAIEEGATLVRIGTAIWK